MEPKKIIVNGQAYKNLNEIPEQFRDMLKDENGNGIPDMVEKNGFPLGALTGMLGIATKILLNGKDLQNINRIPSAKKAELKAKLQKIKEDTPEAGVFVDAIAKSTDHSLDFGNSISSGAPSQFQQTKESGESLRTILFVIGVMALLGFLGYQYMNDKLPF